MIKVPVEKEVTTQAVDFYRIIDERFSRLELDLALIKERAESYRSNATVISNQAEKNIQKLHMSQDGLVKTIDENFCRLETLIAAEREHTSAISGAIALARWIAGALIGISSALVAFFISHTHK